MAREVMLHLPEKTAAHFTVYSVERIQAAFDYYAACPDEIDRYIAENDSWTYERLKQVMPQLNRTSVRLDSGDGDDVLD